MQMVGARWRSGDLVIHHITLLSLSLSVCLTLSGWGGGQVSEPCFVMDGRVGIQKIGILHPQPGWGRNNYNLGAEANGPGQWLSSYYTALGTCLAVTRGPSWCQSEEERKLVISIWPSDFAWLLSTAQSAQCKITRRPSVSREEPGVNSSLWWRLRGLSPAWLGSIKRKYFHRLVGFLIDQAAVAAAWNKWVLVG